MRRLLPLTAILLASCNNLDLPPGCDDILVQRELALECLSPGRCEQILGEPAYVARWSLGIEEYAVGEGGDELPFSLEQMTKRRNCVADYLDNRGITLIERGSESSPYVVAEGVSANFDAVLEFAAIESYELSCSGDICEECENADLEACLANSFCSTVDAQAWNAEDNCIEPEAPAYCWATTIECGEFINWARDEAGDCWFVFDNCIPASWESDLSCPLDAGAPTCN